MKRSLLAVIALAGFVGLWQGISRLGIYTVEQLPGPWQVVQAWWEVTRTGQLREHLLASFYRLGLAYSLAVVSAIPAGLVLGWYPALYAVFNPLVQLLRPISPIAWFPLAVLWFKVGDPPAIFIVFLAAFFPILLATIAAVRNVDPLYLRIARNFGSSDLMILLKVVIPAAFPYILVGLNLALGTAWIHLVAGEMLGAQSGLGYMIVDARNFLRTDLIIAGMLTIGVLGLVLQSVMNWLEKGINKRWGRE